MVKVDAKIMGHELPSVSSFWQAQIKTAMQSWMKEERKRFYIAYFVETHLYTPRLDNTFPSLYGPKMVRYVCPLKMQDGAYSDELVQSRFLECTISQLASQCGNLDSYRVEMETIVMEAAPELHKSVAHGKVLRRQYSLLPRSLARAGPQPVKEKKPAVKQHSIWTI